jgi:hypothetical protein
VRIKEGELDAIGAYSIQEAPMAGSMNFRLVNGNVSAGGNAQQGRGMEGIENQVVQQGYVRIGA